MTNATQIPLNASRNYSAMSSIDRPDCYTAVAWRIYLTKKQNLTLSLCYGSTVIPVVMLNSILCYSLGMLGQWKKPSKFFIFLLAVSDALMGLVSIPATIILTSVFSHQRHCLIERLVVFVGQTNGHFSFYITLAIALQRFVKLQLNFLGKCLLTNSTFKLSRMKIVASTAFFLSCCHGLVSTYFFGLADNKVPNILMMIVRGIILVAIQVCYYRVYMTVKSHLKRRSMSNVGNSIDLDRPDDKTVSKDALISKVNKTILIVMVLLVLSYLPATVADIWTGYYSLFVGKQAPMLPRFLFYVSFTMIFLNCALNAAVLIYNDWSSLRRVYSS